VQHKLPNGVTAVEELPGAPKQTATTEDTMGNTNGLPCLSCKHTVRIICNRASVVVNIYFLFLDPVIQEVKSVDILAALPTPPHNQNEDIRFVKLSSLWWSTHDQLSESL